MQENTNWVQEIQTLFRKKLFVNVESPETDLFEAGLLDSVGLVELLLNLEQSFGFKVNLADLDLDDFRSISRISAAVARAQAPSAVYGATR